MITVSTTISNIFNYTCLYCNHVFSIFLFQIPESVIPPDREYHFVHYLYNALFAQWVPDSVLAYKEKRNTK